MPRPTVANRWTTEAGRGLCFDGVRYFGLERVTAPPLSPVVADELVKMMAVALNAAAETPDTIYTRAMGHPPRTPRLTDRS